MSLKVEPPLVRFEDNDRDYLYWISCNLRGYVVNCHKTPTPDYLMLHWADCWTINGTKSTWTTGDFIKVCSPAFAVLEAWAEYDVGGQLHKCEHCWAA